MTDETLEASGVPTPQGNFVDRIVWAITAPKRLFDDVAAGVHWWQPLVWVSLVNMVTAYISIPIQIQLTRANPDDLPVEQVEQTIEMMEKFGFLGILSTPVTVLIVALICAGVSFLVLSVVSDLARFKTYMCLFIYGQITVSIGTLLSTIVTRMRGLENIRTLEDAYASFGPAMLVGEPDKFLTPILSTFDLFYIWFYVLLATGVRHVFRVSMRSAVLVVLPVWLLFVLIALISTRMAGLS